MLPDLGGLAGQHSGAHVLAAVQLLHRSHHHMHGIEQQRRGELPEEEEVEVEVEAEEVEAKGKRWRGGGEKVSMCIWILDG